MSSINKVILAGHIGEEPEFKLINSVAMMRFPIATAEMLGKKELKRELTEWHNIILWRSLADSAVGTLRKGDLVYIEGKIRTRSFEDNAGRKRYVTEVVCDNFSLLSSRSDDVIEYLKY